jgi:hypothetical protein
VSFASINKDVVTVDPSSGELTVVGPGTATITISGTATYYRNAPKSISYQVVIASGGDANGDGKTDAMDIVAIVNYLMGNPPAGFTVKAADINKDGKVDAADIVTIVNTILSVN